MINLQHLTAITMAEIRLTRRLVRFWVFVALALLFGVGRWLGAAVLHAYFSSNSATIGLVGPRYLVGIIGVNSILLFMIGVIFLGFDIRARDLRERMAEVLDSRPFTNFELVLGRFIGVLFPAWLALVVMGLLMELLGFLLPALGSPVGDPIEPYSLIGFMFFQTLPAIILSLALVYLITLLVGNRIISAVLLFVLIGASVWASFRVPLTWTPLLDYSGIFQLYFPSDVVPIISDLGGWLQRLGVTFAGLGMLFLAAAVHPRLDGGSRLRPALTGAVVLVLSVALMGLVVQFRLGDLEQMETWRQAHADRAGEPAADMLAIKADLDIDPSSSMTIDAEMTLQAPPATDLDSILLSFNPGYQVSAVTNAEGQELSFQHQNGLLEVELTAPLWAGTTTAVKISASGRPDIMFGYLDAAVVPEGISSYETQIFLLGGLRAYYDPLYVALMPGTRWLPATGAEVGRGDPRSRGRDFFNVELEVSLPEGWLVAGPGRRHELAADRFRFAPPAPVPEVCLIASEFESRATEVEGVQMEVLLHRKHVRNLEVLAPAGDEIRKWLGERLVEARDIGLEYPYDGFSIVEIPTNLRGFGGGWRLDTALAPPAMMLLRESSLPTARFDVAFRKPEQFRDTEGGLPAAMLRRLNKFFLNDFSGGNLLVGAARSFFMHQTSACGEEAIPLNFVLEELATHVVTDTRGYFSAHLYNSKMGDTIGRSMEAFFGGGGRGNFSDTLIQIASSRPEVWSSVLDISLKDLTPEEDPQRTIDALTLKGGALAKSLYDQLGRENMGKLLAELRTGYSGQPFTLQEMVQAGNQIDAELGRLFAVWLTTTQLPGLVGEEARTYRLPDAEDGTARYQLIVKIRNDEPVPGVFFLVYVIGTEGDTERLESDPTRLSGNSTIELGFVVSKPPESVYVDPYLSLNRSVFRVPMEAVDDERVVREEPFDGVRELSWAPPEGQIVVDDLDAGFSFDDGEKGSGLRLGARGREVQMDEGLPVQENGRARSWSRANSSTAWGKYRHTFVYVRPGEGKKNVSFTTSLPATDTWDLEIHLPHKERFRRYDDWGSWSLEVTDASGSTTPVTFNASAAARGWSQVGSFDLSGGEVTVKLSDQNEGDVIIADAIRWLESNGSATATAARVEDE
jgi:ABC-type transport system involved in multi-copper enzyme maturation permease subunit